MQSTLKNSSPNEIPLPPLLSADQALFLDVDGTLIELASSPTAVIVPPELPRLLQQLDSALQGAIAVISGRSLLVVDELLAPWKPQGAGVHGAELRLPGSSEISSINSIGAVIAPRLRESLKRYPDVLIEDKGAAVAVHFVRCPQLASECEAALNDAIRDVAGVRIQRGRCVLEALPLDAEKGSALRALMQHAPFAGRQPVFAGDDQTDEMAQTVIRSMSGVGIKVGAGATQAGHRLADPPAVLQWLQASLAAFPRRLANEARA